MTDPLLHEPFLSRPAPRCLIDDKSPQGHYDAGSSGPTTRRRAVWPLRANFTGWALRLLTTRSGSAG